jgi:adenine-specific DNA-methyltransferase
MTSMNVAAPGQLRFDTPATSTPGMPIIASRYPEWRYMGSKHRLLPWIHGALATLDFETALDPFSGAGSVGYLMKTMGKSVTSADFLNVSATIATALIENSDTVLDGNAMRKLKAKAPRAPDFIARTFADVFYTQEDLAFLDRVSANMSKLANPYQRALAMAALARSCLKRQPRGVFTIAGDVSHYDDGRRDLRLSIEEHFSEQVAVMNGAVFSNGRKNLAARRDVFEGDLNGIDLVYLDPPYVPRADDNCYVKRYHFIEGLSVYWKDLEIMERTKVKKIPKKYTPFSYRSDAVVAFDRMFERFKRQTIVLSYSSNGFPNLDELTKLMRKHKQRVDVLTRPHRYHFGTHSAVQRASVEEYLIVGR